MADRAGQRMLAEAPTIKMPKRAKSSKVMKGRPVTGEEFERLLAKVESVLFPPDRKKHAQREPDAELSGPSSKAGSGISSACGGVDFGLRNRVTCGGTTTATTRSRSTHPANS